MPRDGRVVFAVLPLLQEIIEMNEIFVLDVPTHFLIKPTKIPSNNIYLALNPNIPLILSLP